jgi:hemoglobin-like flavoprotein
VCPNPAADRNGVTACPFCRQVGASTERHATYGTKPEHYQPVAEALLWTLGKGLGDGFTPDVEAAWTKVYGVLAATMQAGAAEASKAQAAE